MPPSNNNQENRDIRCPYKGLMPYSEEDAPFFFGREKWSRIITDNLMASRLTLLYGASGVGKSSVLRASVAYQLRQLARQNLKEYGQPQFAAIIFNSWRDNPITGLVQEVEKDTKKILPQVQFSEANFSLTETLQYWAKLVGSEVHSGKLFIILDQFEEYFLYHPHEDGEGTFAVEFPLAINCPDLPANFLISIREDALAKLDYFKGRIPNLFSNYLRIPHLDEESALDAIRKPIRIFNQQQKPEAKSIGIEPELVKEVIEQVKVGKVSLGESGLGGINIQQAEGKAETKIEIETPYLQLVMTRLWEEEMKGGSDRLRLETLKKLKGAGNIVKQHLNQRMSRLSKKERDIAAKVFQFLVTPGGTKIAYPAMELAESAAVNSKELEGLLEKLSGGEQRILRPVGSLPDNQEVERYEIFHGTLAPAILDWRKEYLQKQKNQKSLMITLGFGAIAVVMSGLFFEAKLQSTRAAVSEIKAVLAASNARLVSQEYFDSIIDGLRAFSNLKHTENGLISRRLLNPKTKEDLRQDIQKVLQQGLARVNERNRLAGHEGEIVDVSFSPDGKIIATASKDGTIKLWSLDGKQIKSFGGDKSKFWFWGISFSPNGQLLAAASTDGTVKLWSLDGKEIQSLKVSEGWVWDVSFSPDGQFLASADSGGTVKIWRFDGQKFNPEPIYQVKAHDQEIHKINFSPDGKTLATASQDHTVKLWRFDGKKIEFPRSLKGHTDSIWDVSFSPDSRIIATASSDNTAKLWNLDGTEIVTLDGHKQGVLSVSFTTYGQNKEIVIATASDDKTVKFWNLEGKELQTLTGHQGGVWRTSFSPDGKILATASQDKTVKLWNLNSQDLVGHTQDIFQVSFSPDGKTLATASKDGTVKLWGFEKQDIYDLRYIKTIKSPKQNNKTVKAKNQGFTAVTFSPDGRTIATASTDTTAKLWNLDGQLLKTLNGNKEDPNLWMWDVKFSPDDHTIATASADKTSKLWTLDGTLLSPIFKHDAAVRSLSFSGNGKILATASRDKIVKLWSLDGKVRQIGKDIDSKHKDYLMGVSLSPNGEAIATASRDSTVKLWSINGQEFKEITPLEKNDSKIDSKIKHNLGILSVDFNPDGQLLATASEDETVKLWNLNGELLKTFFGHIGGVISARFSPDGKFIASSGRDGRVIVWNRDLELEDVVKKSCDWVRGYLENNPDVKEDDKNRSRSDQYQSLCKEIDKDIEAQN